jgi:ADP-heptose:LPS heptosyltransferase
VILAHLEAKVEPREWGIANLERLQAELPDTLLLVTASPQYWSANPLDVKHSSSIQRVDTKSILEAAALVAAVDLLLSPDTSIVHFAAALGTPIVAFHPFEDEWLPYRAKSVVLFPKRREPISTIGVAEVRDAIKSLLRD